MKEFQRQYYALVILIPEDNKNVLKACVPNHIKNDFRHRSCMSQSYREVEFCRIIITFEEENAIHEI